MNALHDYLNVNLEYLQDALRILAYLIFAREGMLALGALRRNKSTENKKLPPTSFVSPSALVGCLPCSCDPSRFIYISTTITPCLKHA